MRGVLRALAWVENALLTVLASALLLGALAQILGRVIGSSPVWLDPAMRVLTLWIALVGAVVASREQRQLHIDALVARFAPRWQVWIRGTSALVTAVVCALLAYASYRFFVIEAESPAELFGPVRSHWLAAALTASFALMSLHSLVAMFTRPSDMRT